MSKWDDKLDAIRAMAAIGIDTTTIADQVGTTTANLQTVAKRNGIKLAGGVKIGAGAVHQVPVAQLRRDPRQPREQFDADSLAELAESLQVDGQETPIRFRLADEDGGAPFVIVHGERRWRAAQLAGLDTLEGVFDTRNDSPAERILRQIADNEQRAALTPWDWVVAINRLAETGLKHSEISRQITARGIKGFSRPVVSNYRRLAELPRPAVELLEAGTITPAHGKYLLACKDSKIRDSVVAGIAQTNEAPTVDQLQWRITKAYREKHRGLNTWGTGNTYCTFDWQTTCHGCEHCHKSDPEHAFCAALNHDCFDRHQFAAERQQAAEREAEAQAEADAEDELEAVDLEDLKASDPEEAARIEKRLAAREERKQREAEQQQRQALKARARDALNACDDIDVLTVVALQHVLIDWDLIQDDNEPLNLAQWLERFRLDREAMLRMLADEALDGWVDPDELPRVARMLGLDPDADYRDAAAQTDIEDAA